MVPNSRGFADLSEVEHDVAGSVLGNAPLEAMVRAMVEAVDYSELLELAGDRQALRSTKPPR